MLKHLFYHREKLKSCLLVIIKVIFYVICMTYKITEYTKQRAKQNNLLIKPSERKNKKIDVFDNAGKYLASVGDSRFLDYPTYIKTKGQEYADKRKDLYYKRHGNKIGEKYSGDWLAKTLLW